MGIFPRLWDCFLNRPNVATHRQVLLQQVVGSVFEIGSGMGLNLPWYPKQLQKLSVIKPNAAQGTIVLKTPELNMETRRPEQG